MKNNHVNAQLTDQSDTKKQREMLEHGQIPLFDAALAFRLMSHNKALVIDMLTALIETSLPEDIAMLQQAYAQHDWTKVSAVAHKIQGGAIYCGTTRLSHACAACEYLEFYAKTNAVAQLDQLYFQLIQVTEDTCRAVHDWLNENQSSPAFFSKDP